jgi:DNA polymerase-1
MGGLPHRPDPPPLLLVDGHNLLWAATFGFPATVRSRDKTRDLTGLFAFFALLRVAVRDEVPDGPPEVIVVFDGQYGGAARQAIDAGYKAQRATDDAALAPIRFLPDVKQGLKVCGIGWIELDHAEADDVIATLVAATPPPRPVLVMSRDRDYYQLLNDRVQVLNTKMRAGNRLIDATSVHARFGVTPVQWPDFRALTGDPADNIPGVPGVGASTAAALLAGGLILDELPDSGRLASGRARAVLDHWDNLLKWRDMIRLRTDLALPSQPRGRPSPALPAPRDVVEHLGRW